MSDEFVYVKLYGFTASVDIIISSSVSILHTVLPPLIFPDGIGLTSIKKPKSIFFIHPLLSMIF